MSLSKLKKYFFLIAFLDGIFIWYAIDKVFFQTSGMSTQQIVILGALAWVPQLLFEIPSSIMADRWSRKNVLSIGIALYLVSTVVLGFGSSFIVFAIGVSIWAIGSSMESGTFDALIYDSLKNENREKDYQKVNGTVRGLQLQGMFLAGIVAYFIAQYGDLRLAFFLTVPGLVYCVFLTRKIPEPPITRTTHLNLSWYKHSTDVFLILKSQLIRWVVLLLIVFVAFRSVLYEYYQIFATQKGLDVSEVAVLFSVVVLGMSLTSFIFSKVKITKLTIGVFWVLFLLSSTLGLAIGGHLVVYTNLFILYCSLSFMSLYFNLNLQHKIESSKRASILSSANSVVQVLFLIYAVIFYLVVENLGVGGAISLMAVPLIALGLIDTVRVRKADI